MSPQTPSRGAEVFYALIIFFGIVAFLAHGLAWRYGADYMQAEVEDWIGDQRASGLTLEHGQLETYGYPFMLRTRADAVSISDPTIGRWRADSLDIDIALDAPNRLTFRPRGEQTFEFTNGEIWTGGFENATVRLGESQPGLWSLTVKANSATLNNSTDTSAFDLKRFDFHLGPDETDLTTLTTAVKAEELTAKINGGAVNAPLIGVSLALIKTDALSSNGPPLKAWRQAGGALLVNGVIIEAENAAANFNGEIGLDDALRLEGSIDAEIERPANLARALGEVGLMTSEQAQAAEAGLALAALAQGGKISAPLLFEDGAISIAGVRLGDSPSLR